MDTADIALVFVTTPDADVATAIITHLLAERLIACGTLMPGATSLYTWNGAVETASETQVILKTTWARVTELTRRITELHPYDVPECIAVPVADGLPAYLDWVRSSTNP